MEAVVISTCKSTLNSVVKTATTAITNEIGLLLGVQKELFFIKEELEMMQAFLRAASTENVKGDVVTTWIKQVQELAFDVEDCLHEASVYLMKKSCLPVMFSVKKRDHIARKIQLLKDRIEDVSKRNLRYNLINKENGSSTHNESASTRSIANVQTFLVGLDEPKRKLFDFILKEHVELRVESRRWNVLSVVGMGGLGKTTLVRKVCHELRDKFWFAWVTVQHPFNMEEFTENLAKQVMCNAQEIDSNGGNVEVSKAEVAIVRKKISQGYLQDKKCLIVLDDLSSVSEWDKIKYVLPTGNKSQIIVTTRIRPLGESICYPKEKIYEVKELSEIDAFDLFIKVLYETSNYHLVIDDKFMNDDVRHESKCGSSSTEIIEDDSEEQKQCITINITMDMLTQACLIIKSCGRLPLAIVTIGSYLATKPKTSVEWKTMYDHLSSELGNNPDLGVVKTVLTSSYDGLPYYLKPSLLYLSVFHNHKEIRRSRIIRRWMADGYVMEGQKRTAEEVGKDYFYDLMGRSLIQPIQMSTFVNGDVKRCNIHDMMYELILAKAMDENILSLLEDRNLITMTDKVRHLVIAGGQCTGDKDLERVKLSHMRSISIFGEVGHYLRYTRMKLVRVLDLEGTLDLQNRDLTSVGKLRHLKYLGLRGTKITKLPDSTGKLRELETLDIRNTAVVRLPSRLAKLKKLRYLRAGFDLYNNPNIGVKFKDEKHLPSFFLVCFRSRVNHGGQVNNDADEFNSSGVSAPRGIGELRYLNILGMIHIGHRKGLTMEMQNLTNLSKLAVTGFSKGNGQALAMVIDGLKHLRSLVLAASDVSGLRCCLNYVSSPPKYLQSLKLYSPLCKLPDWISSLENLEKIHFRNTHLDEEAIGKIGELHNLKILYMAYDSFTNQKVLSFYEGRFPVLQVMILGVIRGLELVSIEKASLKRLEQLKFMKYGSRKVNLSGLKFLVQLKEMEVVVSKSESDITFVSNLEGKLSRLPQKPVLRIYKTDFGYE